MLKINGAALITESHPHLIDHLAPLCEVLNIPLIVSQDDLFDLAIKYYPTITSQFIENKDLSFQFLSNNFDILFASTFWTPYYKNLLETLSQKKMILAFSPHGNSDKGNIENLLTPYVTQDLVLLYGDQMVDQLKKQNIFNNLKKHTLIGNLRLAFYQKHKQFFDKSAQTVLSTLNPKNRTILYAPTWNDAEDSSSFSLLTKHLINNLPSDYNLIIKPHPLLKRRSALDFYKFCYEKPNVLLLDDIPFVYPILQSTDIYIGDFSSVGYDFLFFQRPMFFIDKKNREKHHPSLFLHSCGISIHPNDLSSIYSLIDNLSKNWDESFKDKQAKVYNYAFGKDLSLNEIKKNILSLLN